MRSVAVIVFLTGSVVTGARAESLPDIPESSLACYQAVAAQRFDDAARACETAAQNGDSEAQFKFATMYAQGRGVKQNIPVSLTWLQLAAEQGHLDAQYNLGSAYQFGNGLTANLVEAHRWYERAARAGYGKAQRNLASLYETGRGVEQDLAAAYEWYRRSAEQGVADSQLKVGLMLWEGTGAERDPDVSRYWIREAAVSGNTDAQFVLGSMIISEEPLSGMLWFERAINQGHAIAMHSLASYLAMPGMGNQDLDRAEVLAEQAIRAGVVQSVALRDEILMAKESGGITSITSLAIIDDAPAQEEPPARSLAAPAATSPASEAPEIMEIPVPVAGSTPADPEPARAPISPEVTEQPLFIVPADELVALADPNDLPVRLAGTPRPAGDGYEVSEDWLNSVPGDHYTLQMGFSSSLPGIKGLIERYAITDAAHYFATMREGKLVYLLIYGDFASHAEATAAAIAMRRRSPEIDLFVQRIDNLQASYEPPE